MSATGSDPLEKFDTLIAVDWSAASVPVKGENSIWLSQRSATGASLFNFPTRLAAEAFLSEQIKQSQRDGTRLLMGFDFSFGYPEGFARCLGHAGDKLAWRYTWETISELVGDDARNQNNRFEVASMLNERLGFAEGPFWGCPARQAGPFLSPLRPKTHFIAEKRRCEVPVPKSQPGWKLAYVGSVGSQVLMGIPVLERLRQRHGVRVWPFETVPETGPAQVFVELYLTLWPTENHGGPCKDADQVQTMTARWDRDPAALSGWLQADYPASAYEEEGWVLGVTPTFF
mgnify:FL=1